MNAYAGTGMTRRGAGLALGLVLAAALPAPGNVVNTFPYAESFELAPLGSPLVGSGGWYGSSVSNLVVTASTGTMVGAPTFPAATHARNALIAGASEMPFRNTDGRTRAYVDFLVKPALGDQPQSILSTNIPEYVLYFNSQGHIVINHGDYDWSNPAFPFLTRWTELVHTPVTAEQWSRVRITMDYMTFEIDSGMFLKMFQVSLNGVPLTHARGLKVPGFALPPPPLASALNGSWFFCLDASDPDHNGLEEQWPADRLDGFGLQGRGEIDDLLVNDSTNVPTKKLVSLSTYAGAKGTPSIPGTNFYAFGATVLCRVTNSPVAIGTATQMVCRGWTNGTGTVPATGTNLSVSVTMNADSSLRWRWATRYFLDTTADGNGTVSLPDGWHDGGTTVALEAVPGSEAAFAGWRGDVPAALTNNNPLSLVMSQARRVTARFVSATPPQFTSRGTPYEWLAAFGITNNQEAADMLDPDLDGALTWEEYVAGTVPTDARSVFELLRQGRSGSANVVTWYGTTDSGVTNPFVVYRSSNLVNWVLVSPPGGVPRAPSGTNTWMDAAPPPGVPLYYRPGVPWEGRR